jgi:hypothetical protein
MPHPSASSSPVLGLQARANILYFLFVCLFCFQDRVSLYSPDCPGTHFVDQAGLELRNLPDSVSQMLGLKACATIAWLFFFLRLIYLLYVSTLLLSSDTPERASDLIVDGCEPPCGCWNLNSWPLEEQSVLLPAEPSHQPHTLLSRKYILLNLCRCEHSWTYMLAYVLVH